MKQHINQRKVVNQSMKLLHRCDILACGLNQLIGNSDFIIALTSTPFVGEHINYALA